MIHCEDDNITVIGPEYGEDGKTRRYFPLGRGGGIAIYENIVPKELCSEFMSELDHKWERLVSEGKIWRGITMGGAMPTTKNTWDTRVDSNILKEDYSVCHNWYEDHLSEHLKGVINDYTMQYTNLHAFTYPLRDSGYQIQTYLKGEGFYDEHIDGGPFWPVPHRFATVILYMNDVESGGETYFPLQNLKISPVAGRAIMFPSNYTFPHRAEVPLTSNKTILSTFIENEAISDYFADGVNKWRHENMKIEEGFGAKPLHDEKDSSQPLNEEVNEPFEVFNEF